MKDVTIIIKTFEREGCLRRLLGSIRKSKIRCPVLIADDSRIPYQERTVKQYSDVVTKYITMPFDFGKCAGRNELLSQVQTKYFVLCDDDFIFDHRTNLDYMKTLIETAGLELVGGLCYDILPVNLHYVRSAFFTLGFPGLYGLLNRKRGVPRRYFGNFEKTSNNKWGKVPVEYEPPFVKCDYVLNFFMAITESVRRKVGGWDNALRAGEHSLFFLDGKFGGLRVAHTEEVGVLHLQVSSPLYRAYRNRGYEMRPDHIQYD